MSNSLKTLFKGMLWACTGSAMTLAFVYRTEVAENINSQASSITSLVSELASKLSVGTDATADNSGGDALEDADLPVQTQDTISESTVPTQTAEAFPEPTLPKEETFISTSAKEEPVAPTAAIQSSDIRVVSGFSSSRSKDEFLSDFDDRIPEEFHVPADFRDRVGFWFDIYTKYGSDAYVLHHSEYPWIIFRVVDVSHIMNMKTKNPWAPYHKSKAFLKSAKARLASQLAKIQSGRLKVGKTAEEKELITIVKAMPSYVSRKHLTSELREQRGQRDFYLSGLTNSSKYLHQMEEIFAKSNLPVELTRIPLVESSFNTKAVSKVGASGIWQFMPGIGSKFMHVNNSIDERNSPLKATEAAARLLRQNWMIFKAWPLAITAYNHGAGNLLKAVQKLKTKDFGVIVRKNKNSAFGVASSNFYSSFLAALHAEKYQHEIFGEITKAEPLLSDVVRLNFRVRTRRVADFTGMTFEEIRLLNPDLKKNTLNDSHYLPKGYRLHVPTGKAGQIELLEMEAKNEVPSQLNRSKRKRTQVESGSGRNKRVRKLVKLDFSTPRQGKVADSNEEEAAGSLRE